MSAHMKIPQDGQSCSTVFFFFFFFADNQMRGGLTRNKSTCQRRQLCFWERRDGKKDRNEGGWTFCEPSERNETQGSRRGAGKRQGKKQTNKEWKIKKNKKMTTRASRDMNTWKVLGTKQDEKEMSTFSNVWFRCTQAVQTGKKKQKNKKTTYLW